MVSTLTVRPSDVKKRASERAENERANAFEVAAAWNDVALGLWKRHVLPL